MMPKADLKGRINKFSGFKITVLSQEKPYTFNIYIEMVKKYKLLYSN